MLINFMASRRLTHIQWIAALAGGRSTSPVAEHAHAARPMVTDDAGTSRHESWVKGKRDRTEFSALPVCDVTGNLELTLGWALTREGGDTETTDATVQGKTIFKPLEVNGWGIGLAAGTVRHLQTDARRDRMTWVIGAEPRLAERAWQIAESFGVGRPPLFISSVCVTGWHRGASIDATCGNRNGGGERWFSIGLRLLSVPFLS